MSSAGAGGHGGRSGPQPAPRSTPGPDLLVLGTIHTLDPARPRAEALLARDGRVVCLGSEQECRREARPGATVLGTGGGCALPGLADAHGHVVWHARGLEEVDCRGARSAAECAARVAAHAAAQGPASSTPGAGGPAAARWIRGRGWDETRWDDPAPPRAALLDAAAPGWAVALERVDGHALWASTAALAQAGIGPGTPDPPGGRIARDASGRPAGLLVERAQEAVLSCLPAPSVAELMALIERGLADLARLGLTSVHDAGCTSSVLRAYGRLASAGALPLRVYAMIDGTQAEGPFTAELARWTDEPGQGRLTVRAVKLFADGALGSRGAALLEPYADAPGERGLLLFPPGALRGRLARVLRAGFQPAVHAIGDAANRAVMEALASLAGELPVRALRPRLEHLQLVRPEDLPLLAASGAVASMQPVHAVSDAPWVAARLGEGSRALAGAYAWRQVLAAGVRLALGSDFPVESPDPRLGLHAAVTRRPAGAAGPWRPEERLTREEALHGFTTGAAWASFAEGRRGALRPGMDADLTLLGEDVLAVDEEALPGVPVLATVVGGRVEFLGQ